MNSTTAAPIDVQITYQRPGYSVNLVIGGRSVATRYGIATRRQAVAIAAEACNAYRASAAIKA